MLSVYRSIMKIPNKSDEVWKLLVTGQKPYKFKVVPASMLLARIISSTQHDNSPENVSQCVEETYNFFVRYEPILQTDIKKLFGSSND